MIQLFLEKTKNIIREKKILEEKLSVKINIKGNNVSIEGDALEEYEASIVLEAMGFGFSAKNAIMLKDPNYSFTELNIKDIKNKNLEVIRSRLIGRQGKTKKTIESISGCKIIIKEDNRVGIIGYAEELSSAITAITNLIRGSKQSNVYSYLEKRNTEKKQNT